MPRVESYRPRMPSEMESNSVYKEACLKYYSFWIGLLDEKIKPEERFNRADEFFERNFRNGVAEWLNDFDPRSRKSRASMIKELALMDWSRVREGKRHNPPSSYFKQS